MVARHRWLRNQSGTVGLLLWSLPCHFIVPPVELKCSTKVQYHFADHTFNAPLLYRLKSVSKALYQRALCIMICHVLFITCQVFFNLWLFCLHCDSRYYCSLWVIFSFILFFFFFKFSKSASFFRLKNFPFFQWHLFMHTWKYSCSVLKESLPVLYVV